MEAEIFDNSNKITAVVCVIGSSIAIFVIYNIYKKIFACFCDIIFHLVLLFGCLLAIYITLNFENGYDAIMNLKDDFFTLTNISSDEDISAKIKIAKMTYDYYSKTDQVTDLLNLINRTLFN